MSITNNLVLHINRIIKLANMQWVTLCALNEALARQRYMYDKCNIEITAISVDNIYQ